MVREEGDSTQSQSAKREAIRVEIHSAADRGLCRQRPESRSRLVLPPDSSDSSDSDTNDGVVQTL